MKAVFALLFLAVLALYIGAEVTLQRPANDGIARVRWSTDSNPSRILQTRTFADSFPGCEAIVDEGMRGDQTKLLVQCATGVGPDVIDVYNQDQMHGEVEAGILLDLTDLAKERGFSLDKTYPALSGALTVNGRQYRYPCNVWANVIIYNKEIFDDHGVPYPKPGWTWEEFALAGQQFRSPGKSGKTHIPLAYVRDVWMFGDLLTSFGGRMYSEDGLTSRLDSDEALKVWRMYYDLIHKYRLIPTFAETNAMASQGGWSVSGLYWFSSEHAAMIPIARWYIIIAKQYPDILPKIAAVQMPRVPGGKSTGLVDARAAGINVKSPNRETALKFLQYLASPAYNQLIVSDGDSSPPNPAYGRSGEDLVIPGVAADPAFHQVFVDAVRDARPMDISPFIDSLVVERWLIEKLEKISSDPTCDPAELGRQLANEINQTIKQNISRREDLQKRLAEMKGKGEKP